MAKDYQTLSLGDWKLQSGRVIPDACIAYQTFGEPSLPAIIYPSWYSGCKWDQLHGSPLMDLSIKIDKT